MSYYIRTPAEKRAAARQRQVEDEIRARLRECQTAEDTVRVFEQVKATPAQKCDAFWEIDTRGSGQDGTGLLRAARNTPELGNRLFATFK